jgi:hypothetical protein
VGAPSIERSVLVGIAPCAVDEIGANVVVGIAHGVARRAVADFEIDDVLAGFVD